jgi:hypothetical protein
LRISLHSADAARELVAREESTRRLQRGGFDPCAENAVASEAYLGNQLHHPRGPYSADRAEAVDVSQSAARIVGEVGHRRVGKAREIDCVVHAAELRVVENIEGLAANVEPESLCKCEGLLQGRIPVIGARAPEVVTGTTQAIASDSRNGEGSRVRPIVRAAARARFWIPYT